MDLTPTQKVEIVRPSSLSTVVVWIKAAWSEISEPLISRSFRTPLGENSNSALWRHEDYGLHIQRLSVRIDIADSLSHLLHLDENISSDMYIDDDDEYKLDFLNAPDL